MNKAKKIEVDQLCASNIKAKKLLGWKPKYEGLKGFEKGLKLTKMIEKFQNFLKIFQSRIVN
jgi:nucleoside-diphosphate-sugar epimerase|tara:strand:+ start:1101 stop:1286 length:186 start_codon:yes stop_codon:yes gene_type:complete